jgi:hypothetical protein
MLIIRPTSRFKKDMKHETLPPLGEKHIGCIFMVK